jgi:hypothetical protein
MEILEAMTRPDVNGTPALPKRGAPKGLLPSTWLQRTLKVAYVDAYGGGQETSGTLLDFLPGGAGIEHQRGQDAPLMGPARALRTGRRLTIGGNMKTRKGGKVSSENVPSGRKFPRKRGLADETKGKGVGSRKIKPRRSVVNFAPRGR